jgi:hypothetical protein
MLLTYICRRECRNEPLSGVIKPNCPRCDATLYGANGYIYGFCMECAKYILNQYAAK